MTAFIKSIKAFSLTLCVTFSFITLAVGNDAFALQMDQIKSPKEQNTFRQLELLMNVYERVRGQYVEEVDEAELLEGAIRGMLNTLDPHSGYMGPEAFKANRIRSKGEYGGVGLEVVMDQGLLRIVAPMDDTPASRAGLKAGDFITQVDGEAVFGMDVDAAADLLRGPVDSEVRLTIARRGEEEPFDVTLIRQIITISAISHRVERDQIGYIRMTTFNNEKLSRDLRRAIEDMQADMGDDLQGLILDLRNNPGGFLDEAVKVSDFFLEKGEIVSMRGRVASENARWDATPGDITNGLPIVILVNAGSASASEIVVGALQDHRRATIIGDKTFGKGVVQSLIQLDVDKVLRLTTARYYTPAGTSIQAKGIEPDIYIEQPRSRGAYRVRREADLAGHIENSDGEAEETTTEAPSGNTPTSDQENAGSEENDDDKEENQQPEDAQLTYALDLLENVIKTKTGKGVVN